MNTASQPTLQNLNLVLFASEQVIPNLHSILLRGKLRRDLLRVWICHTNDPTKSNLPARRLKAMVESLATELGNPDCRLLEIGTTVESVYDALGNVIASADGRERWIINATGGLKTAAIAASRWVGRDGCSVVYQEFGGSWWTLIPDSGSERLRCIAADFSQAELNAAIDAIPVERWLDLQIGDSDGFKLETEASRPITSVQLVAITEQAAASDWRWGAAFKTVLGHGDQDGLCFEHYVAAGLKAMGASNVVRSFKQISPAGTVREGDLICCVGGRIYILDLKLRPIKESEDTAGATQVYDAWSVNRRFGGLASHAIMIRPAWSETAQQSPIQVAKALGITVLHQGHAPRLFSCLADILRLPRSFEGSSLGHIEEVFGKIRDKQRTVLIAPREAAVLHDDDMLPNFRGMRNGWLGQSDRKWGLYLNLQGSSELYVMTPINDRQRKELCSLVGKPDVDAGKRSTTITFANEIWKTKAFRRDFLAKLNELDRTRTPVNMPDFEWEGVIAWLKQYTANAAIAPATHGKAPAQRHVEIKEDPANIAAAVPDSMTHPRASRLGAKVVPGGEPGKSSVVAKVVATICNPCIGCMAVVTLGSPANVGAEIFVSYDPRGQEPGAGDTVTVELSGLSRTILGKKYLVGRLLDGKLAER